MKNYKIFRMRWIRISAWTLVLLGLLGCKLVQLNPVTQPAPPQAPSVVPSVPSLPADKPLETQPSTSSQTPVAPQLQTSPSPALTQAAGTDLGEPGSLPEQNNPSLALLPEAQADLALLPDVPQYRIVLEIGEDGSSFTGRQAVRVTNQEDQPLDRLVFRLLPNGGKSYGRGFLEVVQVTLDGQPLVARPSLEDTVLEVVLQQPLLPGEAVTLEFDFNGQVTRDFGSPDSPAGYGIYSLADQVLSLSGWYPILAVYDDDGWNLDPVSDIGDSVYSEMAFYTVLVCAPSGWLVAATGVAASEDNQDGCTRYESGPARDFYLAASPVFQVVEGEAAGVNVRSIYLPGDAAAGLEMMQVAAEAVKIFSQRFGAYPYIELDVVEVPLRYASGVEYPGIVLVSRASLQATDLSDAHMTIAHEVAHQWWYNLVGNDVFDEPWLDEGLATYTSAMFFEDASGRSAARRLLDSWYRFAERQEELNADDLITQPLSHFESLGDGGRVYGNVVYIKAAVFFDALRQEIGDEAFFASLQEYYRTNRYRVATTADLLDVYEKNAGRSLDDFYQKWLYAKGIPD